MILTENETCVMPDGKTATIVSETPSYFYGYGTAGGIAYIFAWTRSLTLVGTLNLGVQQQLNLVAVDESNIFIYVRNTVGNGQYLRKYSFNGSSFSLTTEIDLSYPTFPRMDAYGICSDGTYLYVSFSAGEGIKTYNFSLGLVSTYSTDISIPLGMKGDLIVFLYDEFPNEGLRMLQSSSGVLSGISDSAAYFAGFDRVVFDMSNNYVYALTFTKLVVYTYSAGSFTYITEWEYASGGLFKLSTDSGYIFLSNDSTYLWVFKMINGALVLLNVPAEFVYLSPLVCSYAKKFQYYFLATDTIKLYDIDYQSGITQVQWIP